MGFCLILGWQEDGQVLPFLPLCPGSLHLRWDQLLVPKVHFSLTYLQSGAQGHLPWTPAVPPLCGCRPWQEGCWCPAAGSRQHPSSSSPSRGAGRWLPLQYPPPPGAQSLEWRESFPCVMTGESLGSLSSWILQPRPLPVLGTCLEQAQRFQLNTWKWWSSRLRHCKPQFHSSVQDMASPSGSVNPTPEHCLVFSCLLPPFRNTCSHPTPPHPDCFTACCMPKWIWHMVL